MNLNDPFQYFLGLGNPVAGGAQLFAMLLFAKANTFWRSEGMKTHPFAMLFIRATVALAFLISISCLFGFPLYPNSLSRVQFATFILGILGGLTLFLFARSLFAIPAKLVFFGSTVHLLFSSLVGYGLLREELSPKRVLLLVLLCAFQFYIIRKDLGAWRALTFRKRITPFVIGILWGVYYPVIGILQQSQSLWDTLMLTEYGVFTFFLIVFLVKMRNQLQGLRSLSNIKLMGAQAVLSVSAQAMSILCIELAGVIFQSILGSFANILNLVAFRVQFNERLELKYLVYFIGYGLLILLL